MAHETSPSSEQHSHDPNTSVLEVMRRVVAPETAAVAAKEAAHFEATLLILAHRTGENPDMINAISGLMHALQARVMFGDSEKPLSDYQQLELTGFLVDATDRLQGRGHTGFYIAEQ